MNQAKFIITSRMHKSAAGFSMGEDGVTTNQVRKDVSIVHRAAGITCVIGDRQWFVPDDKLDTLYNVTDEETRTSAGIAKYCDATFPGVQI